MGSKAKENLPGQGSFGGRWMAGNEKLLQFIWQFGYFNKSALTTVGGEELTILSAGALNKNQGPDFTNARIKIGSTTLAGSIELHTRTSEWKKHRHETDEQYKNVVLHVVFTHDVAVNAIPVLELEPRTSKLMLEKYAAFMENTAFIPCGANITHVQELAWASWKERLLVERLQRKSAYIRQLFDESNGHWEETFWWLMARNFGSTTNSEAFEAIARSVPIALLAKHKSSVLQLEALLLGQARLLDEEFGEEYPKLLQREYTFLKNKYGLTSSPVPVSFLRMRPGNFPTVRLAQLAMLVHTATHLFSGIIEAENSGDIKAAFSVTANDFWHYHYTFQHPSSYKKKTLGKDTINNLIINTVVPVLFSYGIYHNEEKYKDKALRWLEQTPPESNTITTAFEALGMSSQTAFDSQALLQLKNEYCQYKKCLDCAVGNQLLREAATGYHLSGEQLR